MYVCGSVCFLKFAQFSPVLIHWLHCLAHGPNRTNWGVRIIYTHRWVFVPLVLMDFYPIRTFDFALFVHVGESLCHCTCWLVFVPFTYVNNVCRICTCWWVFIPFEHVNECLTHLYMLTNACPIRIYWGLFCLRDTPVRKLGKTLSRMATRKRRVKEQASHLRKQQTARPHSVHWWLSDQRPVGVGFHCQARCGYHPRRQFSLYGLNLQRDNGGGSSHP